jgi:hypothetical protein
MWLGYGGIDAFDPYRTCVAQNSGLQPLVSLVSASLARIPRFCAGAEAR